MRNLNEAKLNFKIYKLDVLDEPSGAYDRLYSLSQPLNQFLSF